MADNPNILFPSTSSSGDGTDPSIICCNTPFIPNYSAYEVITLSKNPPTDILVNGSSLNSKYDYYIYDSLEDSYASFYISLSTSSYLQINVCFPNENNEYLKLGPSLYYAPAQGSGNCTLPFLTQKNVKYCCITTKNRSTVGYIYKIPFMKSSLQFSPNCSNISRCLPDYDNVKMSKMPIVSNSEYKLSDGRSLDNLYDYILYTADEDKYVSFLFYTKLSGVYLDNYLYILYYPPNIIQRQSVIGYYRTGVDGAGSSLLFIKKGYTIAACCAKNTTDFYYIQEFPLV